MKTALIGGIGNVLLGDDGVGPYVVHVLESLYTFDDRVEIADLGTPALDLTHRIAGLQSVIFVDCVSSEEDVPGTIVLYRKADIMQVAPQRLDPHSPALSECLMTAEMLGASPENVMLVGVVGGDFESGSLLSEAVRRAVGDAVNAVLAELNRLGFDYQTKSSPDEAGIWWSEQPQPVIELR